VSRRGGRSKSRRGALLAIATSCSLALITAPAASAAITEVQSEPTTDDSVSVQCPAGTNVVSGGGEVVTGNAPYALTGSFKRRNGWRVSAYNSTSLIAYAYCSNRDYALITRRTGWTDTTEPLTAKCPAETHIVSGGGGIQNGKEIGGISQTMRKRNGWVADANGQGPRSARAYCTAKRLRLDWSTARDQPEGVATVVCETGAPFSGGGSVSMNGALYATRRSSETGWQVAGFLGALDAQVGCH
jgi:hypothetical protein